ncbi:phytoene desaturase family protein [Flavihumibacter profundi]|uniref:phytoene desaturase family protein n=1 Tax=Flavihumibacter profundi TaxID=2716883 RepID=UPI001CC826E5|nr:NAD(P)/FAD-dependent oxidoreductase [Flavihumibacter profundi]MBZ5857386.1 NAD(P)/FAD-dependent oxidoreductase [Flavihumibacter profundi]
MSKPGNTDFDAIVVGSGPNGLAAAITLQKQGLSVLLLEAKPTIGGGMRTAELTLPGFKHDVCSAIHPLAAISPFFKSAGLEKFGLKFIQPPVCAAHPFDDGSAAAIYPSLEATAAALNIDKQAYLDLMQDIVAQWPGLINDLFAPLQFPRHPLAMARFVRKGFPSAESMAKKFSSEAAKGLIAGMAAHSMLPLSKPITAAFALVLMATAHTHGWPIPVGGSQSIADAMTACFLTLGGEIETGVEIKNSRQLPSAKALLYDLTPKQLLRIAGQDFSAFYTWQLSRFRYGMGVFKIDWALDGPIPFTAAECRNAGTVHLGNSFAEIAAAEALSNKGTHPDSPFVLLAQQSLFDTSRAPSGKQVAWAYCHVPNGSTRDMTIAIEAQVERFAPGFRDRIIGRHVMNTTAMEDYNANYIGGDINGGVIDATQLLTRPAMRFSPYRTSAKGIYICSSATPPGGGVHGMCGYHAAKTALRDVFGGERLTAYH